MKLIVFDLEWNSATFGSRPDPAVAARMPFEIIEIGATVLAIGHSETEAVPKGAGGDPPTNKLNPAADIGAGSARTSAASGGDGAVTLPVFQRRVRPVVYTKLHRYIAKVTARSQESLKEGSLFVDAWRDFQRFISAETEGDSGGQEDCIFACWGSLDLAVLRQNLAFHNLGDLPWARALDVQLLYADLVENGFRAQQRSVAFALEKLELPQDLPFHEAWSDAVYTSRIIDTVLADVQNPAGFIAERVYDPCLEREAEFLYRVVGTLQEPKLALVESLQANDRVFSCDKQFPERQRVTKRGEVQGDLERSVVSGKASADQSTAVGYGVKRAAKQCFTRGKRPQMSAKLLHLLPCLCPHCRVPLERERDFTTVRRHKLWQALARCPEHGMVVLSAKRGSDEVGEYVKFTAKILYDATAVETLRRRLAKSAD